MSQRLYILYIICAYVNNTHNIGSAHTRSGPYVSVNPCARRRHSRLLNRPSYYYIRYVSSAPAAAATPIVIPISHSHSSLLILTPPHARTTHHTSLMADKSANVQLDPYTAHAEAEANTLTPQQKIDGLKHIVKQCKHGMLVTRSKEDVRHDTNPSIC